MPTLRHYGGYDGIFLASDGGLVEVACWAQARRTFHEARSNAPRQANEILEWIRRLCDIEDRALGATAEERLGAGETDPGSLLPDRWAASHPEHVLQHRLDESRRPAARQKARREHRRAKARPKA